MLLSTASVVHLLPQYFFSMRLSAPLARINYPGDPGCASFRCLAVFFSYFRLALDGMGFRFSSSLAVSAFTSASRTNRNDRNFFRNRQGKILATAFVESAVNQVVSKRFVKKPQMRRGLTSCCKSGPRCSIKLGAVRCHVGIPA